MLFVASAQSKESPPATFKKIKFIYEVRSNYNIQESGFFADTLLLKLDFPDLKYVLKQNPKNSAEQIAYVGFDQMSADQVKWLKGAVRHTDRDIYGTYYVKKNKTFLTHRRTKMKYDWETSVTFDTMDIQLQAPMLNRDVPQTVKYDNEQKLSGTFKKISGNRVYENIIVFDPALHKGIVTDDAYFDVDYGVRKISTIYSTTELKSVTYK
jgi:transposase